MDVEREQRMEKRIDHLEEIILGHIAFTKRYNCYRFPKRKAEIIDEEDSIYIEFRRTPEQEEKEKQRAERAAENKYKLLFDLIFKN